MSSKKDRNRPSAHVIRSELAREKRRRQARWISVTAVVLLVAAGLVGFFVYESNKSSNVATPAAATNDGGTNAGIFVAGDGPVTVEVYLDFLCPHCKDFETTVTPTIDQLLANHKIKLVWHTLNFLDPDTSTKYSTRAANAAACASDAGAGMLKAFGQALYANQPAEGSAGLSDDQLMDLAGTVGLNSPEFAQCLRGQKYSPWVDQVTAAALQRGVQGTPTVYVNGTIVPNPTPENLTAAVAAAG
jgi:protein-disulfide isomerase